jgi:FAD/FMN-containing dehydrogenase
MNCFSSDRLRKGEQTKEQNFKDAVVELLKPGSLICDPAVLDGYSGDCSFAAPCRPSLLVYPENKEQVKAIVRLANENNMPLIPVSSGPPRFHGDTVPRERGAIVDFSRMDRAIKIDPLNRCVTIEPGVTYGRLIAELKRHGLRFNTPFLPRPAKSVVTSILEREPGLIPKYQFDYIDPLLTLEVVFGTGDDFRTGSASGPGDLENLKTDMVNPWGPGLIDYVRFLSGAQGTMGLVTWATAKVEILPSLQELYFIPVDDARNLAEPMMRLLKRRIVDECLVLNNPNLAAVLAENWPGDFEELKANLPAWTIIACVAGYARRPEERIEIQRKYLQDACSELGLKPQTTLRGAAGMESAVPGLLSGPWEKDPQWKLRRKGCCHDIFFLTTLSQVPRFIELMKESAVRHGYPADDMGCYVQPMVQGRGCHCEFSLPCDESNPREMAEVQSLFVDASETLAKNGAFFSRPYGPWADMAYRTNPEGVGALRKLKEIFDPNNILNPGKLCF